MAYGRIAFSIAVFYVNGKTAIRKEIYSASTLDKALDAIAPMENTVGQRRKSFP